MNQKLHDCSYSDPLKPILSFESATKAIEWYQTAFGAEETARLSGPEGKIGYAEIWIGVASFAVADICGSFQRASKSFSSQKCKSVLMR